jgi:hypothetical protein
METNTISAVSFKCPACGAPPEKPCTMMDGKLMPGQHSKRKELVFESRDSGQQQRGSAA